MNKLLIRDARWNWPVLIDICLNVSPLLTKLTASLVEPCFLPSKQSFIKLPGFLCGLF